MKPAKHPNDADQAGAAPSELPAAEQGAIEPQGAQEPAKYPSISQATPTVYGSQRILEDEHHVKADCRLVRRAIRGGWGVTRPAKREAIDRLRAIAQHPKPEFAIAAIKTMIYADRSDLDVELSAAGQEERAATRRPDPTLAQALELLAELNQKQSAIEHTSSDGQADTPAK